MGGVMWGFTAMGLGTQVVTELRILGIVAAAGVLGAVIGLEREVSGKPAGIRTHFLVAVASALFVALGSISIEAFSNGSPAHVRSDPLRIMQAVVTGISFIGAGAIIVRRTEQYVEGLTTAASILVTAGVGMAVALGQYVLAASLTVVVVAVIWWVGRLERWMEHSPKVDD
jgi:putative Mg2+ transporter-C (MgtC) family protein